MRDPLRGRALPRRPRPGRRWGRRSARLLAVVVALALVGCTGGGSRRSSDRPRPRVGGTLPIALLDPGPLDPARAEGLEDEIVLGNLFDGLTTIDPAGAVRPAVAASWTSDPTLRRWEFRLRPEARWSDGSPVTAGDFAFAWRRLADPRAQPGPAPARTLLDPVSGFRAYKAGRARSITGLKAPDPATLRVDLDRPFADFPAVVASLPLSPLPAAAVTRDPAAYLTRPVGNGPFRLAAPVRPGRPLLLERNPSFRDSPALLDRVEVHTVPDEQTGWLELQHGQVLFAPVPPDQVAAARTVHGPSADGRTRPGLLSGPTLTTWQVAFDLTSNPASDPRWRQAFSLALDRQRIATAMGATPATTLLPPALPTAGTSTPGSSGSTSCPACTHDQAKARSLFAETGTASTPVTLGHPPGPVARQLATLIAQDLTLAGLTLTLKASLNPQGPAVLVRQPARSPHPDEFLSPHLPPRGPATPLLDQARATPDPLTRTRLYHQAEAAILADLPVTPLLTHHHAAVLAPGVQNAHLTPWNTLDLAAVSLPT
jgi:oligopeptide transport system substrate-binding protein